MKPVIRDMEAKDIPWVIDQLTQFRAFYGGKNTIPVDRDHGVKVLTLMIGVHVLLVATVGDEYAGFIIGAYTPHLFNPAYKMLSEMFWWVAEQHRKTSVGYLLLGRYLEIGKKTSDCMTLSSLAQSPVTEKIFTRNGFHLTEKSYLWEA